MQVADCQKGNPVGIGDGHAAVIGDETRQSHYPLSRVYRRVEGWEGARMPEVLKTSGHSRMIRESEHPPECASQ